MIISTGFFFFFCFLILLFWIVRRGKRAKNSPKWKIKIISVRCPTWQRFCPSRSKIFSNIWFVGSLGGKRKKIVQKWQKIPSVSLLRISGTVYHMIVIFGTHLQKDDISSNVSQFFKIVFLGFFRKVKVQKWPKITRKQSSSSGTELKKAKVAENDNIWESDFTSAKEIDLYFEKNYHQKVSHCERW